MVAVGVLLGLGALAYGLFFTSMLGVRSVQVTGLKDVAAPQVVTVAAVKPGSPMLTLDLAAIRDRVAALPRVAEARVFRSWPSTVLVEVTERTPVGVIRTPGAVHLVDGTGRDYAVVPVVPPGVPDLQLVKASPSDPLTMAIVQVLTALPDKVRAEVLSVSARSPNSVVLALSAGRQIRWGSAEDSARKAAVLAALLTQPGKVYDVSSPQLPTISTP
ncbi:MAG: FtsQ-type POTRA domain-containing protein [Kutzneria sp.]|nr:FtsQ-type POTRA domain-containing protein [Kutzneria sp.]